MSDPIWQAYYYAFNQSKIRPFNVFLHSSYYKDLYDLLRKYKRIERQTGKVDMEQFSDAVKHITMYYYWSKCEWEVIISGWPPSSLRTEEIKVDVYDQLALNWDAFINYIWEHRKEFKNPNPRPKKVSENRIPDNSGNEGDNTA